VKVGDMVEYAGAPEESNDRRYGIIMALDNYFSHVDLDHAEPIVEVLWNTGRSWILATRVRAAR